MIAVMSGTNIGDLMQFATVAVSCAAVYFSTSAMIRDRRVRETREKLRCLRAEESERSDGQHLDLSR